jgi:tetratricopeptide (TPR) repeat protein
MLLQIPVLAQLEPQAIGSIAGTIFWAFISLAGIAKCIKIAKRETTNAKCVYALVFILAAWFIPSSFAVLKVVFSVPPIIIMIMSAVSLVLMTCSILLAILGLAECRQDNRYSQGRKQAIWALVLTFVVIALFTTGFISAARKNRQFVHGFAVESGSKDGFYTFSNLNFRVKEPLEAWTRVNIEAVNPDATFAMTRSQPKMLWMILAEEFGSAQALSGDMLLALVTNNLKSTQRQYEIVAKDSLTIAGIDGSIIKDSLNMGANRLYYHRWIGFSGGILYQIITGGQANLKDDIDRNAIEMLSRFEIINPDRVATDPMHPLPDYASPEFGYAVVNAGNTWRAWDDFAEEHPEADFGGLAPLMNMGFLVLPFIHNDLSVRPEDIFTVMHESIGLESPARSSKPVSTTHDNGFHTRTVSFSMTVAGNAFDYQSTTWVGAGKSLFLLTWAPSGTEGFGEAATALQRCVKISPQLPETTTRSMILAGQRTAHARIFNALGLLYLDAKQHDHALLAFQNAAALLPDTSLYLENTLAAYVGAGRQSDALLYMTNATPLLANSPTIESWKAALLGQIGREAEACAIYKRIFAAGYQDVPDLSAYADLLGKNGDWGEIDALLTRYFERDGSLATRLIKADLYANHGKHDLAIDYLSALDTGGTIRPEVSFRLIHNHSQLGQYAEALAISDAMITNGYATAAAYYQRASAQFGLGWHKKSKASLEQGLMLSPNDPDIKAFLTDVSAILGEGNNSAIKQEIAPVPIPPAVESAIAAANRQKAVTNHGAVLYSDVQGFLFTRGEESKSTRYQRIKVLNTAGVSKFSTIRIPFDPLTERLFVNTLKVCRDDGTMISQGSVSDYYIIDNRESYEASHDKTLCVPVANLQAGCEIELAVTRQSFGDNKAFNFQRLALFSKWPARYIAAFYLGDPTAIKHSGINGISHISITNGLIWHVKDPQPYAYEHLEPGPGSVDPILLLGDATVGWDDETTRYLDRIQARLVQDPAVTALARTLTKDCADEQSMIDSILTHVQKEYTYKPIEFGTRGTLPFPAAETIRRRYGDCKDFAVLGKQLLSALAIDASLVLVDSQFNTVTEVPSLDQFDHMILYIPRKQGCKFVDLTQKNISRTSLVPSGLAGRQALIAERGNVRFETIPGYDSKDNQAKCDSRVMVAGSDISVTDQLTLSGYCASPLRSLLELDEHVRQLWMQQVISRYEPYARVQSFVIEEIPVSRDLRLSTSYLIDNRARLQGQATVLTVPNVWAQYYGDFTPMKERRKPFVVDYPFLLVTETTIKSDVGSVIEQDVHDQAIAPGVEWNLASRREAESHRITLSCNLIPGTYPASHYNQFVSAIKGAIKGATSQIGLAPQPQ